MAALLPTLLAAQIPSDFVEAYRRSAPLEETAFRQNGQLAAYAYLDTADRIVEAQYFDDGALTRRVRNEWDAEGQLTREVQTLYREHEFDVIKEYTYADGQLVHHLHGNNHTGRWSSEGYVYNERGDLMEVEHYRKNGDLAYRTRHDLEYDAEGRLSRKRTTKVIVPTDSTHADWENEVAIGDAQVPTQEAADEAATETVYTYDARGRRKSVEMRDYRGRVTVRTGIRYEGGRRVEDSVYYGEGGGESFRESATYDARGRMVAQEIGGRVRRYRYAGGSGFVVGME